MDCGRAVIDKEQRQSSETCMRIDAPRVHSGSLSSILRLSNL